MYNRYLQKNKIDRKQKIHDKIQFLIKKRSQKIPTELKKTVLIIIIKLKIGVILRTIKNQKDLYD